jgi:hypothetical protein
MLVVYVCISVQKQDLEAGGTFSVLLLDQSRPILHGKPVLRDGSFEVGPPACKSSSSFLPVFVSGLLCFSSPDATLPGEAVRFGTLLAPARNTAAPARLIKGG